MSTLKDQLLDAAEAEFRYYKKIVEDAIGQIGWMRNWAAAPSIR